jgi:predicted DNA-binding transcriptional regulator AlpA
MKQLPDTGYLRVHDIVGRRASKTRPAETGFISVSKSQWWKGVAAGVYPQPIKLGPNTTVWRAEDIHDVIQRIAAASRARA